VLISSLILRFLSQPLLVVTGWFLWAILLLLSGALEALALPTILLMLVRTTLRRSVLTSTLAGVRSIAPLILGAFVGLALAGILNLFNCMTALASHGLVPARGDEANITLGLFGFLVPVALAMSTRMLPLYAHLQPFPTRLLRVLALAYFAGVICWLLAIVFPGLPGVSLSSLGFLCIGLVMLIFTGYFLHLMRQRRQLPPQITAHAPAPQKEPGPYRARDRLRFLSARCTGLASPEKLAHAVSSIRMLTGWPIREIQCPGRHIEDDRGDALTLLWKGPG
jgi:uncharacterized protein involved in response to NO